MRVVAAMIMILTVAVVVPLVVVHASAFPKATPKATTRAHPHNNKNNQRNSSGEPKRFQTHASVPTTTTIMKWTVSSSSLRGGETLLRHTSKNSSSNQQTLSSTTTSTTAVATTATTAIRRSGTEGGAAANQAAPSSQSSLTTLYAISFVLCMSCSMVALAPVTALSSSHTNTLSHTTQLLSAVSAAAAGLEMAASGWFGSVLDRHGRKPALLGLAATLAGVHALPAIVWRLSSSSSSSLGRLFFLGTVCGQKLVTTLATGFFFLTSQTILTDMVARTAATSPSTTTTRDENAQSAASASLSSLSGGRSKDTKDISSLVSAAMGQQLAVTGLGFLTGILTAGQLSSSTVLPVGDGNDMSGLARVYTVSASLALVALIGIALALVETMPTTTTTNKTTTMPPFPSRSSTKHVSPWSWCTRLLTGHNPKVQTLGVLLMLLTLPVFMGDFFQIFAKQEWQLSTKDFSSFLALFGMVGIFSNTAGSVLVRRWGIKRFTTVAILSRIFTTLATIAFGYRGSMIGLVFGFLGSAQTIGIVAALISEGQQSGLPQGEMAGERASLIALLKVVGPILYSTLYIQGQRWMKTSYLPFIFNIALSVVALVISHFHLT